MNRPEDAMIAYKKSLQLAPNRFDSLVGASRAADLAGQPSLAREYALKIKNEGAQHALRP
jgi:cytochrome c-type biogenesis protein CcmH/NrfG